jgi:hypothetical protein
MTTPQHFLILRLQLHNKRCDFSVRNNTMLPRPFPSVKLRAPFFVGEDLELSRVHRSVRVTFLSLDSLVTGRAMIRIQSHYPTILEAPPGRYPSVFRRLITSAKIPNMPTMQDCLKPPNDSERGDLPDPTAGTVRSILTERNKPEESLAA